MSRTRKPLPKSVRELVHKKYGLVEEHPHTVEFYFEKIERENKEK